MTSRVRGEDRPHGEASLETAVFGYLGIVGVSALVGLMSGFLYRSQSAIILLPVALVAVGFISRNVVQAISASPVAYLAHFYEASYASFRPLTATSYQYLVNPGFLFLGAFAAISVAGYFSKRLQLRTGDVRGQVLFVLLVIAGLMLFPATEVITAPWSPSATVVLTLEVISNQSSTPGLALIVPAPLLRGAVYPEIFNHRNPGLFNDYQWSIVNSSFGPSLRMNISSLPEKIVVSSETYVTDPLISEDFYHQGRVVFRGVVSFSMAMPYPLDYGHPTLELNKNWTSHDYFGPCSPPLIDYYYQLAGPIWVSVSDPQPTNGIGLYLGVGNGNRWVVDPYSGILGGSGFGEAMRAAAKRTGWVEGGGWSSCGIRYPIESSPLN